MTAQTPQPTVADAAAPTPTGSDPGTVTIRLFAAARTAAGGAAALHVPAGPLDRLLAHLRGSQPPRFSEVLAVSSLVSDGVRLDPGHPVELPAGAVVDVLPPFAGG